MCNLDIEDVDFATSYIPRNDHGRRLTDEEYADWAETMHVDPYEVLDDFPVLVAGEVDE